VHISPRSLPHGLSKVLLVERRRAGVLRLPGACVGSTQQPSRWTGQAFSSVYLVPTTICLGVYPSCTGLVRRGPRGGYILRERFPDWSLQGNQRHPQRSLVVVVLVVVVGSRGGRERGNEMGPFFLIYISPPPRPEQITLHVKPAH